MAEHIPFVNTADDVKLLKAHYLDSIAIRLSLKNLDKTKGELPSGPLRWLDPAIDGLGKPPDEDGDYVLYVSQFKEHAKICDATFQLRPIDGVVDVFVQSVLDKCVSLGKPDWLSVPQLPHVNDTSRNKINSKLAKSSGKWKLKSNFKGKFILPAVFTNQKQINLKTARNSKIGLIQKCYELSGADGIWVVDSSLSDQDGASTNETKRFPGLISLHRELGQILPKEGISIAGPYWGMNLLLWARELIRFPAVGIGSGYKYYPAGGTIKAANVRVALPPLRRCAVAAPQLQTWLNDALSNKLPKQSDAYNELADVLRHFGRLSRNVYSAREQVAVFYKKWFDRLDAFPAPGRALAMYQDLSSAYVTGKSLAELPDEGTARKPHIVAKQLMVNCL